MTGRNQAENRMILFKKDAVFQKGFQNRTDIAHRKGGKMLQTVDGSAGIILPVTGGL